MDDELEAIVGKIKEVTNYPVFDTDVTRDEVMSNPSFFTYIDKGDLRRAESANQFLQDFTLSFITIEDAEIEEITLIMELQRYGLVFNTTETDYGRIANTENEAKMTTFNFHRPLIVY